MPKKSGQPSSLPSERGRIILREMPPRGSIRIRGSSLEERAKGKHKITSRKRRYRMKKLHGGEPTTSAYVVEKEATSQQPAPVNPKEDQLTL
jgi:hypothetical protein